jgi:hypothetical protein
LTLSPDSKFRDPQAPELDDPAMKEAMPPMPVENVPAVNSIKLALASDESDPTNCHRQH